MFNHSCLRTDPVVFMRPAAPSRAPSERSGSFGFALATSDCCCRCCTAATGGGRYLFALVEMMLHHHPPGRHDGYNLSLSLSTGGQSECVISNHQKHHKTVCGRDTAAHTCLSS